MIATPIASVSTHRAISPTASREVGALLDAAAEVPSGIILSVNEIDNDKTGTFGPFRPAKPLFVACIFVANNV